MKMSNELIEKEILIQKLVVQIQTLSQRLDKCEEVIANLKELDNELQKEKEEYDKLILEHFKDRI